MPALGVDLAARSSAAVLLGDDLSILEQFDSIYLSPKQFVSRCADVTHESRCRIVVEDLPPLKRFDWTAKEACILQGRIMTLIEQMELTGLLHWVQPLRWMSHFGYEKKVHKSTAGFAKTITQEMGYDPPPEAKGKVLQDYRDAYLIARYSIEVIVKYDTVPERRRFDL